MLERLRKQLSRLLNIKKLVADYRWRQEKERNRERFAHLMRVSNTVHTEEAITIPKHGKRPTMRQKIRLKLLGLDPRNWLVCRDCTECFEVEHRVSGEVRRLGA